MKSTFITIILLSILKLSILKCYSVPVLVLFYPNNNITVSIF